ncbi:hypothetical protein [Fluviicola sp.]|uniref:hypothetical protein n=1 Tax=Fluviicola sp. TaxID=1917219 RepID=UPI003D289892
MKTQLWKMSKTVGFVFVLMGLLVVSCKKDEKEVTTDDAADVVSYALESSSGGTSDQLKDCSEEADEQIAVLNCGGTFDTVVSRSYNGVVTGSYTTQRHYTLNCTGGVISSLGCTGSYSGNFDAPRMSSSNSGSINWTLANLEASNSEYSFNGSLNRSGTHTSKVRNKYTFNTSLSINSSNVMVSKTTHKIVSGSGSVTLTCDVVDGGSFDFTGSIVYHANETATLTINGTTYTITLY